jgi:hypothetical protein
MELEVAKLKLQNTALQHECDTQKLRIMELLEENTKLRAHAVGTSQHADIMPLEDDVTETWGYVRTASINCIEARACTFSPNGDMLCVGTRTHVSNATTNDKQYGLLQV